MPTEFTLTEFKDNLNDNFIRANRFLVVFSNAQEIGLPDNYQYLIKSIPLPTKTNGEKITNWFGLEHKVGADITIDDITIVFQVDEEFKIRKGIETWFNLGSNSIENTRGEFGSYYADIEVEIFDTSNNSIARYKFIGCFPVNINAIELSQGTQDEYEELTVLFSVNDWEKI